MKKKLSLNKKTLKNLKLKLRQINETKIAPVTRNPSNTSSC